MKNTITHYNNMLGSVRLSSALLDVAQLNPVQLYELESSSHAVHAFYQIERG